MIAKFHHRVIEPLEAVLKEADIQYSKNGTTLDIVASEMEIFKLGEEYREIKNKIKAEDEAIRAKESSVGAKPITGIGEANF